MTYQPHPAKLEYERTLLSDTQVQDAIREFTGVIRAQYPDATFDVGFGFESMNVQVTVTVDVEDTEEVEELYRRRLLNLQVEQGLPLDIITVLPWSGRLRCSSSERNQP